MPPQKPEPWDNVYPAVCWGNSAPQNMENRYAYQYQSFADHWNYDDVSEHCLTINVWTPGYQDGKKRPVLLWLHGSGFTKVPVSNRQYCSSNRYSKRRDSTGCSRAAL
jgi:para-nitrobenzyl esterase